MNLIFLGKLHLGISNKKRSWKAYDKGIHFKAKLHFQRSHFVDA